MGKTKSYRRSWALLAALTLLSSLSGCSDPGETAEVALVAKGVSPEPSGMVAAARSGDFEAIKLLEQVGVAFSDGHPDMRRAAVVAAVEADQEEVLEYFSFNSGESAHMEIRDSLGRTPLGAAIDGGRYETAEKILKYGAEVSEPLVEGGVSPLVEVVFRGDLKALDLLLNFGADPGDVLEEVADFSWERLEPKSDEALAKLLEGMQQPEGADAENPVADLAGSEQLLKGLIDRGMFLSAAVLVSRGAEVGKIGSELLFGAVADGDIPKLRQILEIGIDANSKGAAGDDALEWAVSNGDVLAAETLLKFGADSPSALYAAVASGDGRLVRLLLDAGIDPNGNTEEGMDTPLCAAVRRSDPDIVSWLLAEGASPSATGTLGQPPLILAAAAQDKQVLQALLAGGADPDIRTSHPHSAEFRKLVADNKTLDFYLRNDTRLTALMFAAGHGHVGCLEALLDGGANRWLYSGKWKRYSVSFAAETKNIYIQQRLLGRDPESETIKREIVVDLSDQKVRMFEDGKEVFSSKVSTGKKGHTTPTGEYVISNKYKQWTSTIYHSSMPYFQRLSWGAFGFHVGYVPNYPASHGCIRMPRANAIELFKRTEVGDFVRIVP